MTDICVKLHIINDISVSAALGFLRRKKCFFRFLQCVILLSKEVALNFVCEIKFLVQKRLGCCRESLVSRLCRKEMLTSGINSSKKAENELKTK